MRQYNTITLIERIISAATYLTAGMAGFVWLIIGAVLKKMPTQFLQYHIFQSIFLSIAYFLLIQLARMVFIVLYKIPFINAIPYFINMPVQMFWGLSIVQVITTAVVLYLAITSFMGMYSYIPYVSDIVKTNTRR